MGQRGHRQADRRRARPDRRTAAVAVAVGPTLKDREAERDRRQDEERRAKGLAHRAPLESAHFENRLGGKRARAHHLESHRSGQGRGGETSPVDGTDFTARAARWGRDRGEERPPGLGRGDVFAPRRPLAGLQPGAQGKAHPSPVGPAGAQHGDRRAARELRRVGHLGNHRDLRHRLLDHEPRQDRTVVGRGAGLRGPPPRSAPRLDCHHRLQRLSRALEFAVCQVVAAHVPRMPAEGSGGQLEAAPHGFERVGGQPWEASDQGREGEGADRPGALQACAPPSQVVRGRGEQEQDEGGRQGGERARTDPVARGVRRSRETAPSTPVGGRVEPRTRARGPAPEARRAGSRPRPVRASAGRSPPARARLAAPGGRSTTATPRPAPPPPRAGRSGFRKGTAGRGARAPGRAAGSGWFRPNERPRTRSPRRKRRG